MEENDNKYLQVVKENIFSKIVRFIKNIFYLRKKEKSANGKVVVPKTMGSNKIEFLKNIKIETVEENKTEKLQRQFEDNQIELEALSDEELDDLHSLYEQQVANLKKVLVSKTTELHMMKYRLNSNL